MKINDTLQTFSNQKRAVGKLSSGITRLLAASQTIRFRVLGLVTVSVLIPSFLAGMLAINYLDNIIEDQVYQNLSDTTHRTSLNISSWFADRSSDVRAFTSSYLLTEEVDHILPEKNSGASMEKSRSAINKYLTYLLEDNQLFVGFSVFSSGGEVLAGRPADAFPEPDNPATLQSIGKDPVFQETTNSDGLRIIVTQQLGIGSDGPKSYFLAELKGERLRGIIAENIPPHSNAYIVDESGHLRGKPVPETTVIAPASEIIKTLGEDANSFTYRGIEGEQVIGTSHPMEHLPWYLITETTRKQAFSPLTTFRNQLFVMTILLAGILLIPALYLARTIILPLEDLNRVSKRIRMGEAGLEVKSRAGGELGELVSAFNSMSTSLKLSMEEIQAINSQLQIISVTDPLTGMYNRRYMADHIEREMKILQRTGEHLSIIMADLDNFKEYNDKYGHIAGDEALKELGEVLAYSIRETDVVSRFGGEEFLISMSHTDKEGALKVAEKIRRAVEERIFDLEGEKTRITISLGVATSPEDGTAFDELLETSDKALYRAKEEGRNCVCSTADSSNESIPGDPTSS
ncbi:MAG: diguanylate cyclase [Deltaproteobacteria bacterium]|nr:diguanylate cyclase [Deltaproteobacteria bacterium]